MARSRIGNTLALSDATRTYAVTVNTIKAANIVKIFREATVAELEEGLSWYRDALALATKINPSDPRAAAGVLAALSPVTPWDRNMMLAARAYTDGVASGNLSRNCAKANAIMAGEDPTDVLSGNKVRAFFECIAAGGETDAVCVDRHALDIALGRVTNDATRGQLGRVGVYDNVADAYRRAAKILGYSPAQVQAVSWVVWRRMKGL